MYNTKNYAEQGGDVVHIGGKMIFEEGAEILGLPSSENQAASTATQLSGLKADFNALLIKLKEAGLMEPDAWNLSVRLAPSLTDVTAAANNAKSSVALADGIITVTTDVDDLEESESSSPGQGTHKWMDMSRTVMPLTAMHGLPLSDIPHSMSKANSKILTKSATRLYSGSSTATSMPKTAAFTEEGCWNSSRSL